MRNFLAALQLWSQEIFQSGITSQAENEVHAIGFTSTHQRVPAESGIGPQNDPHRRPALAYLTDDRRIPSVRQLIRRCWMAANERPEDVCRKDV